MLTTEDISNQIINLHKESLLDMQKDDLDNAIIKCKKACQLTSDLYGEKHELYQSLKNYLENLLQKRTENSWSNTCYKWIKPFKSAGVAICKDPAAITKLATFSGLAITGANLILAPAAGWIGENTGLYSRENGEKFVNWGVTSASFVMDPVGFTIGKVVSYGVNQTASYAIRNTNLENPEVRALIQIAAAEGSDYATTKLAEKPRKKYEEKKEEFKKNMNEKWNKIKQNHADNNELKNTGKIVKTFKEGEKHLLFKNSKEQIVQEKTKADGSKTIKFASGKKIKIPKNKIDKFDRFAQASDFDDILEEFSKENYRPSPENNNHGLYTAITNTFKECLFKVFEIYIKLSEERKIAEIKRKIEEYESQKKMEYQHKKTNVDEVCHQKQQQAENEINSENDLFCDQTSDEFLECWKNEAKNGTKWTMIEKLIQLSYDALLKKYENEMGMREKINLFRKKYDAKMDQFKKAHFPSDTASKSFTFS